jgi:hypothetical protein
MSTIIKENRLGSSNALKKQSASTSSEGNILFFLFFRLIIKEIPLDFGLDKTLTKQVIIPLVESREFKIQEIVD